jgi:phosphatidylserine decarboxylase
MKLAKEGLREMAASSVLLGGGAALSVWSALAGSPLYWLLAPALTAAWLFTLAFFRDPRRIIPQGQNLLVSPADGRVTEISRLDNHDAIGGPAIRIGIFLSVFDVHVNRMPCAGRVIRVAYRPGEFLDARHPESGVRNESNIVVIEPDEFSGLVAIRQVAGLIARRIICHLRPGDEVRRGQRFGIIKFGSRVEVIVPADCGLEPAVSLNEHVRGGATILLAPAAGPAFQGRAHGAAVKEPEAVALR